MNQEKKGFAYMNEDQIRKVEQKVRSVLKGCFGGIMDQLTKSCITENTKMADITYNSKELICKGLVSKSGSFASVYRYATQDNREQYALKHIIIEKNDDKREILKIKTANEVEIQTNIFKNSTYALPAYQVSKSHDEIRNYNFNEGDLVVDILMPLGKSCLRLFYETAYNQFTQIQELCIAYDLYCSLNSLRDNCIMHRDIKPDNIIVVSKNNVNRDVCLLLADFTISERIPLDRLSPVTNLVGTLPFMAPELRFDANDVLPADTGKRYITADEKFAADVYSMAVTILSLLTNRTKGVPKEYEHKDRNDPGVLELYFKESLALIKSNTLKDLLDKSLSRDYRDRPEVKTIVEELREEIYQWFNS